MGMGFVVFCVIAALVWLCSMLAFTMAWWWRANPNRFVAAVIAFVVGLSLTYLGLTRFHVRYSHAVNGRTTFKFDSRWLFAIPAVTGVLVAGSFAWHLHKRRALGR